MLPMKVYYLCAISSTQIQLYDRQLRLLAEGDNKLSRLLTSPLTAATVSARPATLTHAVYLTNTCQGQLIELAHRQRWQFAQLAELDELLDRQLR